MIIGENGVLTQAKNATESHRIATAEEEIDMAWATAALIVKNTMGFDQL